MHDCNTYLCTGGEKLDDTRVQALLVGKIALVLQYFSLETTDNA